MTPLVSLNIHATEDLVEFDPGVRDFMSSGREIIAVDLTSMFQSVLVTRKRLHQLRDALVAGCEKYPLVQQEVVESNA